MGYYLRCYSNVKGFDKIKMQHKNVSPRTEKCQALKIGWRPKGTHGKQCKNWAKYAVLSIADNETKYYCTQHYDKVADHRQ